MKFGVREICDVVLKAKANQKIGNKIFYKNEPVIYFDTLKTSSMEGAATTVYAQGGRGNSRLVAWEGERTITFTMEDALISPAGFMILSGAGLIEATDDDKLPVHVAEQTDKVYSDGNKWYVVVNQELSSHSDADIYVMVMQDGEVVTEPYLGTKTESSVTISDDEKATNTISQAADEGRLVVIDAIADTEANVTGDQAYDPTAGLTKFTKGAIVMVDYYTDKGTGAQQIDITPDKFGGNYYLEASTLFRDTNGVDMPAEFIIPNCKIQSNFTFTMASSGDPSTFTFTMDAFPDYTRFNKTKKVLAAIQIVSGNSGEAAVYRESTPSLHIADANGIIRDNGNG
jgi:hypothetical protein